MNRWQMAGGRGEGRLPDWPMGTRRGARPKREAHNKWNGLPLDTTFFVQTILGGKICGLWPAPALGASRWARQRLFRDCEWLPRDSQRDWQPRRCLLRFGATGACWGHKRLGGDPCQVGLGAVGIGSSSTFIQLSPALGQRNASYHRDYVLAYSMRVLYV